MPTPRTAALLAAALALCCAAGCARSDSVGQGPTPGLVNVVASTDVYGSVASEVGGKHARVTSIIHTPDADPHEYESTPADALAVSRAALLVINGGGYDDFATKLIGVSGTGSRTPNVINVSELSGLPNGPEFNEHVFYSLPTMRKLADTLAAELGKANPGEAADFTHNAAAFDARLDELNVKAGAIKATHSGARIAVTEPVPLYLTAQAGLVDATPEQFSHAVEDGSDPPVAVLQQTLALFHGPDRVRVLLLNGQTESPTTSQVERAATAAGVPVVKVTETLPAGTLDYVSWMDGQITQLAAALGRQP